MGHVHLVTTATRIQTCPSCGRIVVTGLDEGLLVTADPQPLNALGELAARLAGRWTYDHSEATRQLWYRTVHTIRVRRHAVLADHVCGLPPPPPEHCAERLRARFLPDPPDPPY